jgi:hypothetical protein
VLLKAGHTNRSSARCGTTCRKRRRRTLSGTTSVSMRPTCSRRARAY